MLSASAYVSWKPTSSKNGLFTPHPTEVCEPINLAASTQPEIVYTMTSNCTGLSTLQIETIQRIIQSLDARHSFLLGDATGVGKGRTIAGLVAELNVSTAPDPPSFPHKNFKVIWVSASAKLRHDAENEFSCVDNRSVPFSDVILFTSYTAAISSVKSKALIDWIQTASHRLLVLDECHALRNFKGQSAQAMENMIRQVPGLKILYSSATACSIPRHMSYLGRLGLFGTPESPFSTFDEMQKALRSHGPSLMELLAIDLRSRGAYVARQLSFENISVRHHVVCLNQAQRDIYNACGDSLRAIDSFRGSAHQSFFQRLLTGLKVDEAIRVVEAQVETGSSVVISIVNTGEAMMRRREMLETTSAAADATPLLLGEETLLQLDAEMVDGLPENPIDRIVNHFGTDRISELTGRKHRYIVRNGKYVCEKNKPLRQQVWDFQAGRKHVAILSRAGGTGISLHDVQDGRPRVHVILEMPWSAEDLLQQMGRTHRSSSLHPPTYILMTSDVPAELRFASTIVSKLQSFGALVKADRSSCCFSFFKVPKWNISERRSISLYLSMAHAHHDDDARPVRIRRFQALSACQCRNDMSEANIKDRVINMLQKSEELGDRRTTVIAAALRLFPYDVSMLMHRWHPDVHRKFPFAFRQQVLTMLLCAQAWETQFTLGALTRDLLFTIIEHMACPVSIPGAKLAYTRALQHSLNDIPSCGMEIILNRLLGMEIEVQRSILRIADAVVQPETSPPSACFLKYAVDKAGASVDAAIREISHASFDLGTKGVCVAVDYTIKAPSPPNEGAAFWKHANSNRICWVSADRNKMTFSDSVEVRLPSIDNNVMASRSYFKCTREEWNASVSKLETIASRRLHRLPNRFFLATVYPMRQWEHSSRRVLRVPPTAHFPHGIVGLLMYHSKDPYQR